MKNILMLIYVILLGLGACKKDKAEPIKAFEDITYADIKSYENKFSNQTIIVSNSTDGLILKPGSILFYKTNLGAFGKFKIIGIDNDYLLTIDMINFDASGNVSVDKPGVTIQGSYNYNLDLGEQIPTEQDADLNWSLSNVTDWSFVPRNAAKFYVYSK